MSKMVRMVIKRIADTERHPRILFVNLDFPYGEGWVTLPKGKTITESDIRSAAESYAQYVDEEELLYALPLKWLAARLVIDTETGLVSPPDDIMTPVDKDEDSQ